MRRSYAMIGLVALGAALVSWAAFAGAQQNLSKLPPNDMLPSEPVPDSRPTVAPPPQPIPAGPTVAPLPLPVPAAGLTGPSAPSSRLYVPPAVSTTGDGDPLRPVSATTEERTRASPSCRG